MNTRIAPSDPNTRIYEKGQKWARKKIEQGLILKIKDKLTQAVKENGDKVVLELVLGKHVSPALFSGSLDSLAATDPFVLGVWNVLRPQLEEMHELHVWDKVWLPEFQRYREIAGVSLLSEMVEPDLKIVLISAQDFLRPARKRITRKLPNIFALGVLVCLAFLLINWLLQNPGVMFLMMISSPLFIYDRLKDNS